MLYKNREVTVLRPVGGSGSWADDLVVVRVLESGEEETVRKGDIVGYTEDPNSEQVKKGEALSGTSRDPNHPARNANVAKEQEEEYRKNLEEKQKEEAKKAEEMKNDEAYRNAPVVQTLPFDAKKSTAPVGETFPATTKTSKK